MTTPPIHTIPNIHAIHTIPTLHRKHSIPIILTIQTRQTIHTVTSNIPYPTDLPTIPTIHTIPHPHHTTGGEGDSTTPRPHHRGGGGQYYGWPMTMAGGGGGLERWTIYIYIYVCIQSHIYIYVCVNMYILSLMLLTPINEGSIEITRYYLVRQFVFCGEECSLWWEVDGLWW